MPSDITYYSYPRTERPPRIADKVADAFRETEDEISSIKLQMDSLGSNEVLGRVRPELEKIGFSVEGGTSDGELERPVIYGKDGEPSRTYRVDAYHAGTQCALELEAGRGAHSNAVHRNLVRAMTLDDVEILVLALPNLYERPSTRTEAFDKHRPLIERLYRSNRVDLPFRLVYLGY